MTARVLVVGAVNVDLVVATDRLPGPGETVVGGSVERFGGGKGANAAVAAARAGAEVRYCGAVGADDTGVGALAELRAEGVDVTDVAVLEGVSTGMALIVVDGAGENQIAVGAGANAAVTPQIVQAAVERSVGWADCVLVSTEIASTAIGAAVHSADAHGIPCVINPAPVRPGLERLLPMAFAVTPNASELAELCALIGASDRSSTGEMALAVASGTKASVVVTLGGAGALVVDQDLEVTEFPAPAAPVRDTTGAGDTFNGVLATAIAGGIPLLSSVARGVTAASLSVGSIGARAGMPSAEAIDRAVTVNRCTS